MEAADPELLSHLQDRFGFDDHDLAANRVGLHSDRQRQEYLAKKLPYKLTALALVVSSYSGWGAASDQRSRAGEAFDVPYDWDLGLKVFAAFLAFLLFGIYSVWWKINRLPLSRGPKSLTGPTSFFRYRPPTLSGARFPATAMIGVGKGIRGRHFPVEPEDKSLVERMPYATIYWNQGSAKTKVHSIEPAPAPLARRRSKTTAQPKPGPLGPRSDPDQPER